MGGGTGTGVAPVVASVARDLNAVTFAVPILPFDTEGVQRRKSAADGTSKLKDASDFTIVLDNNKLIGLAADMPMAEALKVVDRSVMRIIDAVCDQTSSYVSSIMEDITGFAETVDEPGQTPPANMPEEHFVHAEIDPMFNGFGPNMFG